MSFRRAPNPNRNFPSFCPYCGGEDLWPNEETDFAWKCGECLRIFEVKYHGQDDPDTPHAPAPSTEKEISLKPPISVAFLSMTSTRQPRRSA